MTLSLFKKIFVFSAILSIILSPLQVRGGEETLCYTEKIDNAPSFHLYTGWDDANNPITWKHTVPPGILDTVVRVGLYIEAWDVDYPANDEHDRVYFNGHDLGLLEGRNDTWITVEKTIPASWIREGINELSVGVDELKKGWKVTIRSSELRFYCSKPDPDFAIGASPASLEVEAGGRAEVAVVVTALNDFSSPVNLSVAGLPDGITGKFMVNPVTPSGETKLILTASGSPMAGTTRLIISGEGDSRTRETEIELVVKESPCPGFEADFVISPDHGPAPLKVKMDSKIIRGSKNASDYTFAWDLGDGSTAAGESVTRVYPDPGTYSILLEITDKCGNTSRRIRKIHVDTFRVDCEKSVDRTEAEPGDVLTYRIQVENSSEFMLENFSIEDQLSDALEYISQSSTFECTENGRLLTWKGRLSPSETGSIEIKARIRQDVFNGTRIENHTILRAPALAEEVESNSVYTTVSSDPVSPTKVKFTKRTETPVSRIGQVARFRLAVDNRSSGILINLIIEDFLPQGFSYVPESTILDGVRWTDPRGKRRLQWIIPAVSPGQRIILRFQTVIGSDVRRGRNTNRAFLTASDNTGQTIHLEDSDLINVSSDGMIFFSGVRGTVYIDRDRDRMFSPSDTPLQGIEVRISTGEKTVSGSTGEYSFENLFPGDYAVGVNRATLPEKYTLAYPFPVPVYLNDGLTDTVDFAVRFSGEDPEQTSRLEGLVFFDRNRNLRFDAGDTPAENFKVKIDNKSESMGEKGKFVFSRLDPGKHRVEISCGGKMVAREVVVPPGNVKMEFPLKYSGIKLIVTGEK